MNLRMLLSSSALLAFVLTACPDSGGSGFTVGLSSPSGTAYTNGTLNVQATVSGGTPESLELLRNGTSLATLSAPYTYAWDTSALSEGGYSLGVRATNGGKFAQGEARTVFVDRTAPTVNLTSATATLTSAGNLDLNAEVSDNRGIARVEFFDGGQKLGETTSNPFALSLNLSSSDNREHTYSAKATDRAGNSASSIALKVNVLIPKRISENLIINGDAEAGPAGSGNYVSDLPGWPLVPPLRFTVVAYGTAGFPSQAEAPPGAGNQFFAGGPDVSPQNPAAPNIPDSTSNFSIQSVPLPSDWSAAVDAGTVTFDLSGDIGSIGSLEDTGVFSASCYDAGGTFLTSTTFKGVSALERGGKTGFVRRAATVEMPRLTRSIRVALTLIRTRGRFQYNVGLADNLSLMLKSY
jgi:Bacterial Ig domain